MEKLHQNQDIKMALREEIFRRHEDKPWHGQLKEFKGDKKFKINPDDNPTGNWFQEMDVVIMFDDLIENILQEVKSKLIELAKKDLEGYYEGNTDYIGFGIDYKKDLEEVIQDG